VALLLTGKQLTTPVWIGILMLMGIVTKNAIMLVEFAVESIRAGKPREEAIIDAGMKRTRTIVVTTIAMAAGMMPSALAFGAGGEFRSPMALAVIGGLLFSTVLSLVFVPAMFMLMDDIGALFWHFGKTIAAGHRAFASGGGRRSADRAFKKNNASMHCRMGITCKVGKAVGTRDCAHPMECPPSSRMSKWWARRKARLCPPYALVNSKCWNLSDLPAAGCTGKMCQRLLSCGHGIWSHHHRSLGLHRQALYSRASVSDGATAGADGRGRDT
jgi:hypothetical protein